LQAITAAWRNRAAASHDRRLELRHAHHKSGLARKRARELAARPEESRGAVASAIDIDVRSHGAGARARVVDAQEPLVAAGIRGARQAEDGSRRSVARHAAHDRIGEERRGELVWQE